MKRPRSQGEGFEEDGSGEKGRDWGRRDQDGDRHSPHRRYLPKIDRTVDIEREPLPRSLSRKRFDYEPDSVDRRKASSDRYRSSSPRDRGYSFGSSSRRDYDYPKGFRSDREKPRRDEVSSSSWRRSNGGKDAVFDDPKVPSIRSSRLAADESVKGTLKSSPGGDQVPIIQGDSEKLEEAKEMRNSSEREEGELEPDVDFPQVEQKSSDGFKPSGDQENAGEIIKEEEGVAEKTESFVDEKGDESDEREIRREKSLPREEEEEEEEEEEVLKTDPSSDEHLKDCFAEEPEKKREIVEEEPAKEENSAEVWEKLDHQEEVERPEHLNLESEVKPEEEKQKIPEDSVEAPLALKFLVETSDLGKGKGLILDDPMEGPSTRVFDLFSPSRSDKGNNGVFIGKRTDSTLVLEQQQLDLSLSLPGVSSSQQRLSQNPRSHIRSRPSSLISNSDGFTASASFSGSQRTIHNPSCSLSHASLDNFENSVSSRPLFKPVDQISKDPFFRRPEANGKPPQSFSSLLTNSRVVVKSEEVHRERNNTRPGIIDWVLSRIISDPLESSNRMIQEMTDQSIAHLHENISIMITDHSNQSKLSHFREILHRKSELNLETLSKFHPSFLSILVSVKTGLPGFIQRGKKTLSSSDLAEVFLNLKCKNIQCLSILPVDDCDCKICSKKRGFCSACMCLTCGNFDSASNTCGWVGCDVCLHWCHTDCALKDSHIKNGEIGGDRKEVQFICVACDHPSEMFGFVKEVFKTYAVGWRKEILVRELEFIRRIFGCSEDTKGMRLHAAAAQQLLNLGKNKDHGEVVRQMLGFLAGELIYFIKQFWKIYYSLLVFLISCFSHDHVSVS